jgi:hypothetical protein
MNGPAHYREAERLADSYKLAHADVEAMPTETVAQRDARFAAGQDARALLAKASVHATLALAAAAAYPAVRDWLGDEARDGCDWTGAVS